MSFQNEITMHCDHKGCKNELTAESRAAAWNLGREKGWQLVKADEVYCPTHRTAPVREAKAKTAKGKGTKAGKAGKGKMKSTRKAGNVISYTPADEA